MKKYIIIILASFGLVLIYKSLLYLSEHGIVNLNRLSIDTDSALDNSKVKVVQGLFSINRQNDAELFYDWPTDQIVFDGVSRHRPKTGHGENDFLLIYDNKYYFQFRHIQTNESENNAFNFYLTRADTSVYLEVKIDKGVEFKRRMNLINQSQLLLTNKPLDSIKGGSYNGI